MDPEELVICPYDPVHRVALKKLPYHINKCRKQYDPYGEYKKCPFNARHIIPAPEFPYHMETCEAKAAIDMEIAFEQSKHEVSNATKGCTDIPPMPDWQKPKQTENWDDDATPVLRPQPLIYQLPDNLPRPTPSRPVARFNSPNSPKKSPNRYPSPFDRHQSPRGARSGHSPRLNINRTSVSPLYHEDDDYIPIKRSPSTPEVDNEPVISQDEFLPNSFKTSPNQPIRTKENTKKPSPSPPQQNVTSPQSRNPYQESPSEFVSKESATPQSTSFSPIPLTQPLQQPLRSQHHQLTQQQQHHVYNPPQQIPTIQYQTQTQQISSTNSPPLPVNDQVQYKHPAMRTTQRLPTYYGQQPQHYSSQPTTAYYTQDSYAPNTQPAYPYQYAPPPVSQMSVQRQKQNAPVLPPEQQQYIPTNTMRAIPDQQMYNNVPTGVNPPSRYESSVVSSVQYGRGRGRGLLYTGSHQKKDKQNSFHTLPSQM